MAADPRVVAVGETGLDWYWLDSLDGCASKSEQLAALQWHMELAATVGKPLMIHNRDADEDLMAALDGYALFLLAHRGCPRGHCTRLPAEFYRQRDLQTQ